MKPIPLTRSATVNPFVRYLNSGNGSAASCLNAVGIVPEFLDQPETLVPLQRASSFADRAAHRDGIEDLGLRVGSATPIVSLGLFGLTIYQSLTLKDVIGKLERTVPLLDSGAKVWTERSGRGVIRLCLRHAADEGRAQIDAYALMLLIDAVRLATGPEWRPRWVAIDRRGGRLAHQHEALSDAEIDGQVDHVAFEIPVAFLGQPVRRNLVQKLSGADTDLDDRLTSTAPALDFGESVAQAVGGMLNRGAPTIEAAAEMAGTSLRTFQRQLEQNGLSYRNILDQVRYQQARELLGGGRGKVAEIAAQLGYSDEANFIRAFRRWTGFPPSVFRNQKSAHSSESGTTSNDRVMEH